METKDIIRKFSVPDSSIVDYSAGTFSVAKTGALHFTTRRFVGCDLALECVASSLSQLTLVFACQVWNKELDITGGDDV